MTIHSGHPFADPEPDPARRVRGRLGGAVTLWTAGGNDGAGSSERAGLTITSVLMAGGEPWRVLALVDPDSDFRDALERTGRAVVQLLEWEHRDLAEAFAGTAPAPGGAFRTAEFEATGWGPRLASAPTWIGVRLESVAEVGWSDLVTCTVEEVTVGEEQRPLLHRRGRFVAPSSS